MKRIFLAVLLVALSVNIAVANLWCLKVDGSDIGINCKSDSQGHITIDNYNYRTLLKRNALGYYLVVDTMPVVSSIQERTTEIWGFETDHFTRTWSVRTLSATEQNEKTAAAMPLSDYWLWKALILTGTITQTQAQNVLPTELIQAYQARAALEEE